MVKKYTCGKPLYLSLSFSAPLMLVGFYTHMWDNSTFSFVFLSFRKSNRTEIIYLNKRAGDMLAAEKLMPGFYGWVVWVWRAMYVEGIPG